MADFDTFTIDLFEFWDDNAIEVRVKGLFWGLLSPLSSFADVALSESDDVLVFGVIGV